MFCQGRFGCFGFWRYVCVLFALTYCSLLYDILGLGLMVFTLYSCGGESFSIFGVVFMLIACLFVLDLRRCCCFAFCFCAMIDRGVCILFDKIGFACNA